MFRRRSSQREPTGQVLPPQPPSLPELSSSPTAPSFTVPNYTSSIPLSPDHALQRHSSPSKARVQTDVPPISFHRPGGYGRPESPNQPESPRSTAGLVKSPSLPAGAGPSQPPVTTTTTRRAGPERKGDAYNERAPAGSAAAAPPSQRRSIASLYPSPVLDGPPPVPNGFPKSASLPSIRRSHKIPPRFNVLVVGPKATGKTGFIKTLLGNVQLAGNKSEQQASQGRIRVLSGGERSGRKDKPTTKPSSITVDVLDRGERISLTLLDSVGLEKVSPGHVGDELQVERQLNAILKTIEGKFDETLKEENEVFRHSHRPHDEHAHLCLYFIDPDTITTRTAIPERRQNKISIGRSVSSPQLAAKRANGMVEPVWSDEESEAHGGAEVESKTKAEDKVELVLSEIDVRCLRQLSRRVNVMPVIARSDELTIARLAEVKDCVKRELSKAGLDFGVFDSTSASASIPRTKSRNGGIGNNGRLTRSPAMTLSVGSEDEDDDEYGHEGGPSIASVTEETENITIDHDDEEEEEEEDEPTPPVRLIRIRSTSRPGGRSSRGLRASASSRSVDVFDHEPDEDAVSYQDILPFALVAPEVAPGVGEGEFVRLFKYGRLDVLNPEHSDFTPLRSAIFSHMTLLKDSTRLNKYEPYRTQRLLARRPNGVPAATRDDILREVSAI